MLWIKVTSVNTEKNKWLEGALHWTSVYLVDNKEKGCPLWHFCWKAQNLYFALCSSCRVLPGVCQQDIRSLCRFSSWTLVCALGVAVFGIGTDFYVNLETKVNERLLMNCNNDRLWHRAVGHPGLSFAPRPLPPHVNMLVSFMALSYPLKREQQICLFSLLYFDFSCGQR